MSYPTAFRLIRARSNLTKAGLAEALGVHESYVSLIESGRRPATTSILRQLQDAFDLDSRMLDFLAGARRSDKVCARAVGLWLTR